MNEWMRQIDPKTGRFLSGWSTRVGNKCVCKSCGKDINCKPSSICTSKHYQFYEKTKIRQRDMRRKEAIDVLLHYGGKCTCCGFNDLNAKIKYPKRDVRILSIDHMNGGGGQHIRKI